MVDNKEQNPEIKVRFELDEALSGSSRDYTCTTNAGFSDDHLECSGTKNDDQIWVKVMTYLIPEMYSWNNFNILANIHGHKLLFPYMF